MPLPRATESWRTARARKQARLGNHGGNGEARGEGEIDGNIAVRQERDAADDAERADRDADLGEQRPFHLAIEDEGEAGEEQDGAENDRGLRTWQQQAGPERHRDGAERQKDVAAERAGVASGKAFELGRLLAGDLAPRQQIGQIERDLHRIPQTGPERC